MDRVNESQELSFSPPNNSFSPPTPFARNGIRYNEFREILNTAVQASQHDRPIQRQAEVLGTDKIVFEFGLVFVCHPSNWMDFNALFLFVTFRR